MICAEVPVPLADATLSCPLCACDARRLVRREAEGTLVRCAECAFCYVSPRPSEEDLRTLYDDEYFDPGELQSCLAFRAPVFAQCLARLRAYGGRGRLLDVGCGTGEFVAAARAAGWDAEGMEASRRAAQFAREQKGLPVRHATLESAGFAPQTFGVVTLLDVLEHLLDPRAELARVHELLRPGGLAVVRVPNLAFQLARARLSEGLRLRGDAGLDMRCHLNHFTPRTLRQAMRRAGLEVLGIEVGAAESKAHAAWAPWPAKRAYVTLAALLERCSGINLGNIMVAYARRP